MTKSRRPSGRNVFPGYISEGWRDFLQGIDQKPKAVWRERFFGAYLRRLVGLFAGHRPKAEGYLKLHFFGSSQRVAGEIFRKGLTQSRRLSGATFFRVVAAGHLSGFLQRINPKSKAVFSHTFSGYRSGLLGEPRGRCEKAVGSGRALKLF